MILGIDIGCTAVKLVAARNGGIVCSHYEKAGRPPHEMLRDFLGKCPGDIRGAAVTGMGAESLDTSGFDFEFCRAPELSSIAAGATHLAGEDRAIVANIGTGTAFLKAENGGYTHLGGTGVGGGALEALGRKLLGADAAELCELAEGADLGRIDLTIGDVTKNAPGLDPTLTAANLVKANEATTDGEWAIGILNMLLQTVGSMAMLCCRGAGIETVIVTGAVSELPVAPAVFSRFEKAYGIRYVLPPQGRFATALGAVLETYGKDKM